MPRPYSRMRPVAGVAVELETTVGSGEYRVDPYLSPEEIVQESGERISRARLGVRLGADLSPASARLRYQPDRRIFLRTTEAVISQRRVLFQGYLGKYGWSWSGDANHGARMTVEAYHVTHRLTTDPRSQVLGRAVRSLHTERSLEQQGSAVSDQSDSLTAPPCRFNADGKGNCSCEPMVASTASAADLAIPLFARDDASEGHMWSYGEILRYLLWFHLPGDNSVGPGNGYEVTQYLDAPGTSSSLGGMLLECPRDLVGEATNLLEALLLVTAEAGLRFHVETVNVDGQPCSQLKFWNPAQSPRRHLSLGGRPWDDSATTVSQAATESFDTFLDRHNTHRGDSHCDYANAITSPLVVGGAKKYEITAELVPGWLPEAGLDNVDPGQRDSMKSLAMTEESILAGAPDSFSQTWYKQYHRRGEDHSQHEDVARKWVLNESGDYQNETFGRSAPFGSYEPFDLPSAIGADRTDARRWMRRRRQLLPFPADSATGMPGGVIVEISFDSGTTWSRPNCGITVLTDECGVVLDCTNPTDVAPVDQDRHALNMWYALLEGGFRVRVRALVESDERMVARGIGPLSGDAPISAKSLVIYRPQDFEYADSTAETIDDTEDMQRYADRLAAHLCCDRRLSLGAMPWLDCEYQIGDRLVEPLGPEQAFDSAVILAKRYVLAGGRAETELLGGPTFAAVES